MTFLSSYKNIFVWRKALVLLFFVLSFALLPQLYPVHAQNETECSQLEMATGIRIEEYGLFATEQLSDENPPSNRTSFVLKILFNCIYSPGANTITFQVDPANPQGGWLGIVPEQVIEIGIPNSVPPNYWERTFSLSAVSPDFQGSSTTFQIFLTNNNGERIPIQAQSMPDSITNQAWLNLLDGNTLELQLTLEVDEEGEPVTAGPLACGTFAPLGASTPVCPNSPEQGPCCPSVCTPTKVGLEEAYYCGFNMALTEVSPTPRAPAPPCEEFDANGHCIRFTTAVGVFNVDVSGIVGSILGLLLSISGMIAVYLIIRSGYQLMTSQGNPEAIQAARERLTSAIVGLLFIIFSFVIIQVIGIDILQIPGFSN